MVQKRPFDAEEILERADVHKVVVKVMRSLQVKFLMNFLEALGILKQNFPVVGIPASSWATSSTTEEEIRSEPPLHFALFPEYFSPERPIRTFTRYEDIYTILLEHSPRKLVSVGVNHQADVPAWDFLGSTSRPNASDTVSDSDLAYRDGDEAKTRLMGTCIIPMPQMELSSDDDAVGKGRTDCSCEDMGSMRCVRQHIVKKEKNLKKPLGMINSLNWGFTDMGEQVAEKWSVEDEQLFHEVVFNNPASLDKNFWNYLSIAFPSLTKKEIVSYYFNVFMLRRRAEQNRNDLLNIDSDNDEWQGSDGNEIATREEDEDSVAESPVYQDDTCIANCNENDLQDCDEYAADEIFADNRTADLTKRNINDGSKIDL
ncbi:SANT/Myb domain [Sesbania bispinosa]|nr:SANT/Myb domain [Sesbania bispinosa]